ncbi:CAP domain-containing protein [Streptomyces sp. NPDC001508]|uniref:CAP domain-containing protein n=1 Tax=Streptomyces sp. NPDC001508 TaxID=3154656 RepID=UPI00332F59B8
MRRTAAVLLLVLTSLLADGHAATAHPHVGGAATRILDLTNAARAKAGCGPLRLSPAVGRAARRHARDLIRHDRYSHTGSDGSDPGERIRSAGYRWHRAGENIFLGPHDAQEAARGWLRSPEHRANILNCAYRDTGIAVQGPPGHRMWVQDFAAR